MYLFARRCCSQWFDECHYKLRLFCLFEKFGGFGLFFETGPMEPVFSHLSDFNIGVSIQRVHYLNF